MQGKLYLGLTLFLASLAMATPLRAEGNLKAGAALAAKCEVCHGRNGVAPLAEAPNLSGQKELYIIEQLTKFKSGERQNEMMAVIMQELSDQDIENAAKYYSSIPVTVGDAPTQ